MWRNVRAAALNATFQLLVIYKCLGWIVEGIIITQNHKSTKELNIACKNIILFYYIA